MWRSVARRSASNYFVVQGVAGAAWWALMLVWPASRAWFLSESSEGWLLGALAVPDLALYVVGSLIAAWVCRRSERWAPVAAGVVSGAAGYAALLCLGLSFASGGGWLGTTVMFASALTSAMCVWLAASGERVGRIFRSAPEASERALAAQTVRHAALFWTVFLLAIPLALSRLEHAAGVPAPRSSAALISAGAALFLCAGSLGVASATVMVRRGHGTPLPLSGPSRLVTSGPYGCVRNPMAVAGLLQGAGVALALASPVVLFYVLLGGVVWDSVVRPLEEHDLHGRFGAEFDAYAQRVRRWIPTLRAR